MTLLVVTMHILLYHNDAHYHKIIIGLYIGEHCVSLSG